MALEIARTYDELIKLGKEAETSNDYTKASKYYEKAIKLEPHAEFAYTRLMVIFRKTKDYESELKTIQKGIESFESYYEKRAKRVLGRDSKAIQLSNSLAKSLGLKDRKGKNLIHPEPIGKWIKRAEIVKKKLQKK